MRACFAAGTPIRTAAGSKPIEELRDYETHGDGCDRVLARDELNDDAPVRPRRVLRRFVAAAEVLELRVQGRTIGTTAAHPFWVEGKGWTAVKDLAVGERLRGHDGQLWPVESVTATTELAPVYNCRIAEYHTYFVQAPGGNAWLWAHNAYDTNRIGNLGEHLARDKLVAKGWTIVNTLKHGRNGIDIIAQRVKNGKVISTSIVEVKANGGRLSTLQQMGANAYARNRMLDLGTRTLDAGARSALQLLNGIVRAGKEIKGVVMGFDWRSGSLREWIRPW